MLSERKNIPVKVYELVSDKNEILTENINLIKLFEQGIDHYFKQEWKLAVSKFKQAENLENKFESRNTTPSQIYIERCKMFMENPPEKDWDGVWKMTSK